MALDKVKNITIDSIFIEFYCKNRLVATRSSIKFAGTPCIFPHLGFDPLGEEAYMGLIDVKEIDHVEVPECVCTREVRV